MVFRDDIKFFSNFKIGQKCDKYCCFCKFGIKYIDYKDVDFLIQFVNEQGKILFCCIIGNFLKYQCKVVIVVKCVCYLVLMFYVIDLLK